MIRTFCFALLLLLTSVKATVFSHVVIFGDSLSDIGNHYWATFLGNDEKILRGAPYTNINPTTGNRDIWVNAFVKNSLLATHQVIAVNEGDFPDNTNLDYAWASAETGRGYVNDKVNPNTVTKHCSQANSLGEKNHCIPNVLEQQQHYFLSLKRQHRSLSANTLYIIWAGGNDIFNNIDKVIYRFKHPYKLFFPGRYSLNLSLSYNIFSAVRNLTAGGVPPDHIVVVGLPDIGKTPGAKELLIGVSQNKAIRKVISSLINTFSESFNRHLSFLLSFGVRGDKKPIFVNINRVFNTILKQKVYDGYIFIHSTTSCVADKRLPYCRGHLFFDDKHPTSTAHQLIAAVIVDTIKQHLNKQH